jgi:cob(I)alamin adenosyltransferase
MVRLDRITTRTGDDGTTGMADGTRLAKDHPLIGAIGSVDEANCVFGLLLQESLPAGIAEEVGRIQNDLFDLGGDLATPPGGPYEAQIRRIHPTQVARLEAAIADGNDGLPQLRSFVLPGGSRAAAWLHLARTVVRRAERDLVAAMRLVPERAFNPELLHYLNRLSDLCFVWSRRCNVGTATEPGPGELLWRPGLTRGPG